MQNEPSFPELIPASDRFDIIIRVSLGFETQGWFGIWANNSQIILAIHKQASDLQSYMFFVMTDV